MSQSANLTIMFADIAGSTKLYDELGDAIAYEKIVNCLQLMSSQVEANYGTVVETIGDEIMCSFEDANHAIGAASAIQESMKAMLKSQLSIRVGMHSGETGIDNGHPFGDVVNVASRMSSLARGGEVVFSADTLMQLSDYNKESTRSFGRTRVKGKAQPIETFELNWDQGDSTSIFTGIICETQAAPIKTYSLQLSYQGTEQSYKENGTTLNIGRSGQNEISLNTNSASRHHAVITINHGLISYKDHSTNGSFIKIDPSNTELADSVLGRTVLGDKESGNDPSTNLEFFLRRDEWTMAGSGLISLGEPVNEPNPCLIRFCCTED